MLLQTERLTLREFEQADFDSVLSYDSDMEVVKYVSWGPFDEAGVQNFLTTAAKRAAESPRRHYHLGVCLKETGKLFGTAVIYCNSDFTEAMIGWVYHRDYWNKGYGTEAAGELIRYCFEELKLHRVFADCDADNIGSYKIMEKCGMRFEGRTKKSRDIRGVMRDERYYAILEEEYFSHSNK